MGDKELDVNFLFSTHPPLLCGIRLQDWISLANILQHEVFLSQKPQKTDWIPNDQELPCQPCIASSTFFCRKESKPNMFRCLLLYTTKS